MIRPFVTLNKRQVIFYCMLLSLFILPSVNIVKAEETGEIRLTNSHGQDVNSYSFEDRVYLRVSDPDLNTDPLTIDSIVVEITSDTEDTGMRSSATTPVPGPSNRGNGTMSGVITSYTTITENWAVTYNSSGRFSVNGSYSGIQRDARIGERYTSNNLEITFTIIQGSIPFVAGDQFSFSTYAGATISESVTLMESDISTGTFTGSIALDGSGIPASDGDLDVSLGDTITAIYRDGANIWGELEIIVDTAVIVSGSILGKTTWTASEGPYYIYGDIVVDRGVTLTIEPGTQVRFLRNPQKKSGLFVFGRLIAQGTASNPIVFTSGMGYPERGDWYGVVFPSGGDGVVEYCQIDYADNGVHLDHALSSMVIRNNTISNSRYFGIACHYTNALIELNTITGNEHGVSCYQSSPTVRNNNIVNNINVGIACRSSFGWQSPLISNNTITNHYFGIICVEYSTPLISKNIVQNNRDHGISYAVHRGAELYHGASENTIRGNGTGIVVSGHSSPFIHENILLDNINYAIKNYTTNKVDALYNWWGETVKTEMETGRNPKNISAIYDYFDNIYYGIVYYAGWLGSEPPVLITLADFYAIPRDKYIKLIWSTASEIENAGFNILKAESEKDEYVMINGSLIPAIGSPIQGENYEFIDIDVVNDKTYYYLLEDIDIYGLSTMHGPVSTALKKE